MNKQETPFQPDHEHPETGPDVTVTVDGTEKTIHRGSHLVSEFKTLVGVDASLALDQVIGGEFRPLNDNDRITIKGREVFVSHVRSGGSA